MVFTPRYEPCAQCGESLEVGTSESHVCEPERRAAFEAFQEQGDVDAFHDAWVAWLTSTSGAFETWRARRAVRRRPAA